ncbi:TPA: DUF4113 domain-containing protein, partial [Escherichia coli]|nr:DUF4113 domain-containing protein [Escherichia coli]HBN1144722.1 DUF4113 domain-containing protein [Escherichia coli]HBN1757523.1 DUF4113 domain-containing protein [Escherichia coli]HBN2018312.1 DUF4113 domain-containing protein [Escherichia coli]HBN2257055.1 DUF4113 domain-containing protein [Escherichia coli]
QKAASSLTLQQCQREMLSPAYTTRWSDIPAAKLA